LRRKALFLDRDGVINIEKNYVHRIEDFEFTEGIFDLCRHFIEKGFIVVVITNQAGIARGYYSEKDFKRLTKWMLQRFEEEGIEIATVKFCPHHPDFTGPCLCRKPEPGMILEAASELDIDLSESVLIGDKMSDIEAGKKAGLSTLCLIEVNKLKKILENILE